MIFTHVSETPAERYDRQYNNQDGLCAACQERVAFPRLFGIESMYWAHAINPDAPRELLCLTCANAMKRSYKTPERRRSEYIERYMDL